MSSIILVMDKSTIKSSSVDTKMNEEQEWIIKSKIDLNSFSFLYEKYYEKIYLYVYRRCSNEDDCLDITSKVFEKAMLNIQKYEFRGFTFGTWLIRIAHNELMDYFRNVKKDKKLWVQDEGLVEMSTEIQFENTQQDMIDQLLESIIKIKPLEQELIVMRFFEKRNYEEIAEIQNSNANAMRVKIHRILIKIKLIIERNNSK